MRIACPSCSTVYEVPEARLSPRKMVRCAHCGSEWMPVHVVRDVVAAPAPTDNHPPPTPLQTDPLPAVTAMDRLAATPAPATSSAGLTGAWVLTVLVLAGSAAAAVIWRDTVMQAWPPSALILAPFGHMAQQSAQTEGKPAD